MKRFLTCGIVLLPILVFSAGQSQQQPVAPTPFFARRRTQNRMMFSINPRYDHQEAWLWIHELLESETEEVELSDIWEQALEDIETDDPR